MEATLNTLVDATLYQHQIAAVQFVCDIFGVESEADDGLA